MSDVEGSEDQIADREQSTASGLTPDQIQQFKDDGFLIVRDLLPREALRPLIDEMEQKVDEAAHEAVKRRILDPSNTFEDAPFETRLSLICRTCSERNWLWEQYFYEQDISDQKQKPRTAGMFILRTWPSLLDVLESVIGPEILGHPTFNIRTKLPDQEETVIPWHQDLAFLTPEEAGDTLVANFWIPLVTATAENGCMQMMRGSHRLGLLPQNARIPLPGDRENIGIADADLPDCGVVTGEVDVGDVLMTTERLVHRSLPNTSNNIRWSVDTRYSAIGLPTGRDHVPGFVVRSLKNPESVARSHHDWNRLFEGQETEA